MLIGFKSRHNLGSDLATIIIAGVLSDVDDPLTCCNFLLAISTVGIISMNPEADLGVLEGSDAHGHVVILLHAVDIHPLVA